jgi:hypothetical protein
MWGYVHCAANESRPTCHSLLAYCSKVDLAEALYKLRLDHILRERALECTYYFTCEAVANLNLGRLPDYQLKCIADLAEIHCFAAGNDPMQRPPEPEYPVGQIAPHVDIQQAAAVYMLVVVTGAVSMTTQAGRPLLLYKGDYCFSPGTEQLFSSEQVQSAHGRMVHYGRVTTSYATVVRYDINKLGINWTAGASQHTPFVLIPYFVSSLSRFEGYL